MKDSITKPVVFARGDKFSTALDSYMASAPKSLGTFDELRRWLIEQVVRDVSIYEAARTRYLDPLVKWAVESQATIATLNYDRCVEDSADRCSITVDRAVGDWANTGKLTTKGSDRLRLLKLHGSVDWEFHEGDFLPEKHADQDYFGNCVPGIIYGQRGKLRPEGPFLQLLEAFRQELDESERLIVVGYSLGDSHINTILDGWLRRDKGRTMLLVDPYFSSHSDYSTPQGHRGRFTDDPKREFWEVYGPGRPVERPPGFAGGMTLVRPMPAQIVAARIKTDQLTVEMERVGVAELIKRYREDPDQEYGWVDFSPVGTVS